MQSHENMLARSWVCAACYGVRGDSSTRHPGIPLEGTMEELKKGISRRNLLKGATLSPLAWRRSACLAAARRAARRARAARPTLLANRSTRGKLPRGYHRYRRNRRDRSARHWRRLLGNLCALNAAQNGTKVTLVEKVGVPNGHGVGGTGAIASKAPDVSAFISTSLSKWSAGFPRGGSRCRESLVAKWFRESERCMNWLLDLAELTARSAWSPLV